MKKFIIVFFAVLLFVNAKSQGIIKWETDFTPDTIQTKSTYHSWDGYGFSPVKTFRSLNILINIIWDVKPDSNSCPSNNGVWDNATVEGVNNQAIPISNYMSGFLDINYSPSGSYNGYMTKLYQESSFGSFIVIGDFVVVNIKQSSFSNPMSFNYLSIANMAISKINVIGLSTIYVNNSITDYDSDLDSKVDFIQFYIRNPNVYINNIAIGTGYSGISSTSLNQIKINNVLYDIYRATINGVGDGNISYGCPILTHELSHLLFGTNAFHTSGGYHYGTNQAVSSIGMQGGYGLMGCANSNLTSCNGYERWRMHWKSPIYNTSSYFIAANNVNSDIQQSDGSKTFILRDFVTTGDAVRIKLPYKDNSNCSNQYIWLENHQVGNNNKIDFFHYSNTASCRNPGTAGIYAYYQIGRDVIESTDQNDVWPEAEADNLKQITPEGNWDMTLMNPSTYSCVGYSQTPSTRTEILNLSNPLMGYNDLQMHFYDASGTTATLSKSNGDYLWKKYYNQTKYNDSLPYLGDIHDAFTSTNSIGVGTNPATNNLATYYLTQGGGVFSPSNTTKNNTKIYLSGLKITMTDLDNGTFQVDVVWNDYNVNNDIRWTGEIILREQLNLVSNKTILLDQNYTPYKIYKDAVTNVFASTTKFNCESNSVFTLQANSNVELNNLSALTLESGSTLNINGGSKLIVKQGCSLIIKSGANLNIYNNGSIEIENGGYICIENSANINLTDYLSVINLRPGYICGINPSIGLTASCVSNPTTITVTGNGAINTFTSDEFIQNITISTNKYYTGNNISAGYDVTTLVPYGNVLINNNAHVVLDAANNIILKNNIEIQSGCTFEMK